MNTAEQLENMISSDVELGTIGSYKEEVAVWNAIFSSLYGEELNQAANDFRLADVYCQIRDGILDTLRSGKVEYVSIEIETQKKSRRTMDELASELLAIARNKYQDKMVSIGMGKGKFYLWIDDANTGRQTIYGNYNTVKRALA